ncbi:MAG: XdhC family protein [Spirosomaceae bacterium]|jgi:xanthine/CO dehydrogenase XdhC/CoxF family maturation factor|nr:XdhC family protein [Spirosomataceae bacterium]
MKELKTIIEEYNKIDFSKNKAALATVVRVEGSSYRRTGARMLVMESGEWIGGISGGCLEGDALKKARLTMSQNKPTLITYDTSDDDPYQIGVGLGCNGIIDVLITPLNPENPNNAILQVKDLVGKRTPNAAITVLGLKRPITNLQMGDVFRYDSDEKFGEVFPINEIKSQIIDDLNLCLKTGRSLPKNYILEDGNEVKIFIEVLLPDIHLVLYGTNYDIYPMVRIAKELGWKVSVICNPQKVHSSLFQTADEVLPKDANPVIDTYTAVVLMSHDYENDYLNLLKLLKTEVSYIGMLGPAKRNKKMYDRMAEEGVSISEDDLKRIHNPIGLDIGATTPEEIAVSIAAEIRSHFAGRAGTSLKFRGKPIHE